MDRASTRTGVYRSPMPLTPTALADSPTLDRDTAPNHQLKVTSRLVVNAIRAHGVRKLFFTNGASDMTTESSRM